MARYYHVIDGNEAPAPGANIVVLPPENVFWSALPEGHRLTFDGGGLPDGTEPDPALIPDAAELIAIDLEASGITGRSIAKALYLDGRGIPGPLNAIDVALDAIALSHGVTLAEVLP